MENEAMTILKLSVNLVSDAHVVLFRAFLGPSFLCTVTATQILHII